MGIINKIKNAVEEKITWTTPEYKWSYEAKRAAAKRGEVLEDVPPTKRYIWQGPPKAAEDIIYENGDDKTEPPQDFGYRDNTSGFQW